MRPPYHHFIRKRLHRSLIPAFDAADSEHEVVDLGHNELDRSLDPGIAHAESKTQGQEPLPNLAAFEDGFVVPPRVVTSAENRPAPIPSGVDALHSAEPESTSAARPASTAVPDSSKVNIARGGRLAFSVSRIATLFALDHHCDIALSAPPQTSDQRDTPVGDAGVVLENAATSRTTASKAEHPNCAIEAASPCCSDKVGDDTTTTAPLSPSDKSHVEFIASEMQRVTAVIAVVPEENNGRRRSVEVVVEEHAVKLKSTVGAQQGDDDDESVDGIEGAKLESVTSLTHWVKYMRYYPRGDIYRHLDSCVVPALQRVLANGSASYLTAPLLHLAYLRKRAAAVVTSRAVDWLVLLVIILSSVNLGLQEPRIDSCSVLPLSDPGNCVGLSKYLDVADVVITVTFAAEAGLQLFARGLAFSPFAYMHNGWRLLDALVVSVSIAALAGTSSGIQSLRALRALRAMRALRGLARFPHLKLVVDAMIATIPKSRLARTSGVSNVCAFVLLLS